MTMTKMTKLLVPLIVAILAFAHTTDAYGSYREWLCEQVYPQLKNCTLQCPEGKAWVSGCPTCMCRKSLCQQKFCQFGQRCTIKQQATGQYDDSYTEVAVCEDELPVFQPQTTPEPSTPVPTQFQGSCDYQGRCDANGACPAKDSECRNGNCCRVKLDYNMGGARDMAKCLETPDEGKCRALGTQYVYNKGTGKCESMMYGGCVSSRNSFATMAECQKTCEHPCQKPRSAGRCRASIPRYYFNEDTEACEPFDLGGCAGTGNYFMTPWDCETHCKGLKSKVKIPINTNNDNNEDRVQTNRPVVTNPPVQTFRPVSVTGQETLRQRLIKGENNGRLDYKSRVQPGRQRYVIDNNGNVIYINTNQYTTPRPITSYNNGMYRHLADRVRSAQQATNNFEKGQVNYRNLRARLSGSYVPSYLDRGLDTFTKDDSYKNSVDALRRYMQG